MSFIDGTRLRRSATYTLVYRVIFMLLFNSLVPFVLVLIFSIRMIIFVKKARKARGYIIAENHLGITDH